MPGAHRLNVVARPGFAFVLRRDTLRSMKHHRKRRSPLDHCIRPASPCHKTRKRLIPHRKRDSSASYHAPASALHRCDSRPSCRQFHGVPQIRRSSTRQHRQHGSRCFRRFNFPSQPIAEHVFRQSFRTKNCYRDDKYRHGPCRTIKHSAFRLVHSLYMKFSR